MTAFIWDLDGTLLDSYDAIVAAIGQALETRHLPFDPAAVRQEILATSVHAFFAKMEEEEGESLKPLYQAALPNWTDAIQLLQGAREILEWAQDEGIQQFVFTHKDKEAHGILEKLGIGSYFTEVVTATDGYARKPDPEALLYLMTKYQLPKGSTYYIGDRLLDIEAALAAGVHSINFLPHPESHLIHQLEDIKNVKLKLCLR